MDHIGDVRIQDREALEAVADALSSGVVMVDTQGDVLWMDRTARQRANGELGNLPLPLRKPYENAVDCFAAPVELIINGQHVNVCVLQQTEPPKEGNGQDLMAAIETIMADSASWFSRTVMEKLKAIGKPVPPENGLAHDLDALSDREREVLGLICEGKSSAIIGEILQLSENTVRNHIASLYRKIGVNRRSAAIIWARERGITGCSSIVMGRAMRLRDPGINRRNGRRDD
ncbi:MAG: response regulator transcription factor [Proteobacteria bacterium]|nr:response regulator transcription factor [Pseudomonadota bacterium]